MSLALALQLKQLLAGQKEKAEKKHQAAYKSAKNRVGTLGTTIGGFMQATAALPGEEPSVEQSVAGGALSGFSSGFQKGGLFGGLGMGVVGAVGGYVSGSSQLEQYLLKQNEEQNMNITSKTVQPQSFEDGGDVGPIPIQTELGETVILPSTLELVKVAAKELHKNMDKDKMTDLIENGAIVFSNAKDNMFDPKSISDNMVGIGVPHYSEHETYAPEEMKIDKMFGNKKITFAEASEILKRKIQVVDDKKSKDIFDEVTNAENKMTRMMYLQELIGAQENNKLDAEAELEGARMFRMGGKVEHYGLGGGTRNPIQDPTPYWLTPETTPGSTTSDTPSTSANPYYQDVLKKLGELRGQNEETFNRGKENFSGLSSDMRGSVGASLLSSTVFNAIQDPNVDPVIQDTTFINDSFRTSPISLQEQQVGGIRSVPNDLAQQLLSSGVDPKDVPQMVATSQSRALTAETALRSKFITDRVTADQGKYKALRANLMSNRKNFISARNDTRVAKNSQLANFGTGINTYLKDMRTLRQGEFDASRKLEKEFNDNELALFQTEADISGNQANYKSTMDSIDSRMNTLEKMLKEMNT